MFISIIVPFYNEEKYLNQCARSLINQKYDKTNYEIIFIDNASTDKSAEIVRNYPEIILLKEEKRGSYAARNLGIKHARGEIIAFTDGDCEATPNWLRSISNKYLVSHADILLGKYLFDQNSNYALWLLVEKQNELIRYLIDRGLTEYCWAYTSNMAVRKSLFKKNGFFYEWLRGADTEFIQRCIQRNSNLRLAYVEGMGVSHSEIDGLWKYYCRLFIYGRSEAKRRRNQCAHQRKLFISKQQYLAFRRKFIQTHHLSYIQTFIMSILDKIVYYTLKLSAILENITIRKIITKNNA